MHNTSFPRIDPRMIRIAVFEASKPLANPP